MEQLTITKIERIDAKTGDGRDYVRVNIRTREKEGILSGFGSYTNKNWKEGDVVEVELEDKTGANGTVYHNFKTLSSIQLLERRVKKLENAIFANGEEESEIQRQETAKDDDGAEILKNREINVEEIPF